MPHGYSDVTECQTGEIFSFYIGIDTALHGHNPTKSLFDEFLQQKHCHFMPASQTQDKTGFGR